MLAFPDIPSDSTTIGEKKTNVGSFYDSRVTIIINPTPIMNSDSDNDEESGVASSVDASTTDSSLTCWGTKKPKSTTLMSHNDVVSYYDTKLGGILFCMTPNCECLFHSPQSV